MERMDPTAEASLAEILARSRLGMAIAAMMRMIATTIRSSINEKPFCFFILLLNVWRPFGLPLKAGVISQAPLLEQLCYQESTGLHYSVEICVNYCKHCPYN